MILAARQSDDLPDLSIGLAALARSASKGRLQRRTSDSTRIDIAPRESLSAFHYGSRQFRVPYLDLPVHKEFRTWSKVFHSFSQKPV